MHAEAQGQPDDPAGRFLLEIDDQVAGVFGRAVGLRPEREIHYIQEGGQRFATARLGPYAQGHFALEVGTSDALGLFEWFDHSRNSDAFVSARRTGHVVQVDAAGKVLGRWRFRNAQITEWVGLGAKPEPGEVYQVDRVGISHEGLEPIALT